jgi:hypothetical protein
VELGPGACHKVRRLLDGVDHGGAVRYVPFDVAGAALTGALATLARDYPALDVRAVVGDFEHASTGCRRRPAAASCSSWAARSATSIRRHAGNCSAASAGSSAPAAGSYSAST